MFGQATFLYHKLSLQIAFSASYTSCSYFLFFTKSKSQKLYSRFSSKLWAELAFVKTLILLILLIVKYLSVKKVHLFCVFGVDIRAIIVYNKKGLLKMMSAAVCP